MKNRAERFLSARVHANLTQVQAAQKIGVLQQTINKVEKGIISNPRAVSKYAETYFTPESRVTPEWLMFGTGTPPVWATTDKGYVPEGLIPLLEWDEISEWIKNGSKNLDMIKEERDFVSTPLTTSHDRKKIFAVKVKNDLMISFIPGAISFTIGSILIAEPMEKGISGDYVIVKKRNEKEPFFRQIIKEGDRLYLRSLNNHYETINVDSDILPLAVVIERRDILI